MPIYMDVHIVPGVKANNVAEAHRADLFHQSDYGCKCMTYWVDEQRESVFCLIEGPDKEAVQNLHNRAHGLLPSKIIEVKSSIVESFLGRIYDPSEAEITEDGLKVFADPSFRILMVTSITDPVILSSKLGHEEANELVTKINQMVRKHVARFEGREAEHDGNGFIVSFGSAKKAVSCAINIHKDLDPDDMSASGFRVALNCGEPIEKSNRLFGDTIQLAKHICSVAKVNQVGLASAVKDLVAKDLDKGLNGFFHLSPQDESFLKELYAKLEQHWQDPEFDVDDYCKAMAMSRSQLYRKTIQLTGLSPNILLKEYRLDAAREMMRKQKMNISQITFNSGFTSPSYFTKCFRKKFGILPMAYFELLH